MSRAACVVAVLVWTFLVFARLGHYALWDDESLVALDALGVQRTGDTTVRLDHGNIVAYRDGLHLHDGADRALPPLAAYLTAASFDLLGVSPWAARLPFAGCGVGTILFILLWARKLPGLDWKVMAAAFAGNVSLVLFCRQCRYYSLAIFLSVVIAYAYWHWPGRKRNLLLVSLLAICLYAANPMSFGALGLALGLDYLFWGRHRLRLSLIDGALLLGPVVIVCGWLTTIWNPFRTGLGDYEAINTFLDRLTLFYWSWRDMNRCEFFSLPLLLAALIVGLVRRRGWMVRGCLALVVYLAAIAFVSPQTIKHSAEAEVRYFAPLIPLALALQASALILLFSRRPYLLVLIAALAFGTNLFNGGPLLSWGMRSTFLSYLGELSLPPEEPYTPTAAWIRAQVPEGASIWVAPFYAAYPLMFAAPQALYGWQLTWPPKPEFAGLPDIQYLGRQPPDYIVAFGPVRKAVEGYLRKNPAWHYEPATTLDVYWKDMYRPELYWRTFVTISNFDSETEGVTIFRRIKK